jgi:hypothetical protein
VRVDIGSEHVWLRASEAASFRAATLPVPT